ncbi:MAG: UbiD family decarboxylase [Smithellaceae bacterium]|nr:UbiD family decarboxylase [Smithellaceae bacterium]
MLSPKACGTIDSLEDYLEFIKARGWLLTIREEVGREDIPAFMERLSGTRKALLFEAVKGYNCRLAANIVPSHEVFTGLFGRENPYDYFLQGIQRSAGKILLSERNLKTTTMADKDLTDFLPILTHYEKDSAPFITTGIVSSPDPDTGVVGRGIHRLEYRGGNRLGLALLNPPLTTIHDKYRARGEAMPVAITIGVDPVVFLAMALKAPPGTDKLEVAGGLKGKGVEVIGAYNSSADVPAAGEFLLEGRLDESKRKIDGPLGEISGYYLTFPKSPTVLVERLSHRENPIYHALLPTALEADTYLTFVSRAHLEESAKRLFPFIVNIAYIPGTFGASLVICVKTAEKFRIRNLLVFLLSFPMIKKVVIVDDDVNPEDLRDVEWAVVTRCKADEDIIILNRLQGQPIDPLAEDTYGVTKIGINATVAGKKIADRVKVTGGNSERIERIIRSLGVM